MLRRSYGVLVGRRVGRESDGEEKRGRIRGDEEVAGEVEADLVEAFGGGRDVQRVSAQVLVKFKVRYDVNNHTGVLDCLFVFGSEVEGVPGVGLSACHSYGVDQISRETPLTRRCRQPTPEATPKSSHHRPQTSSPILS